MELSTDDQGIEERTPFKKAKDVKVIKPFQNSKDDEELKSQEIYRKICDVVNNVTAQNFGASVKQIKALEINTEERLKSVVSIIFEKALSEKKSKLVYANLCKQLSMLKVPIAGQGGCVNFRKLLLTKCQKKFEEDLSSELRRIEKMKISEDSVTDVEKKHLTKEFDEEKRMNHKRRLANIHFIGELFKLGMLIEPIMHECIKKLLHQGDEDSLESLCQLLTIIGKELETRKEKESREECDEKNIFINGHFAEMQNIADKRETSWRIKFMLQNVIELRKRNWIHKQDDVSSKAINKTHKKVERSVDKKQLPFLAKQYSVDVAKNPGRFSGTTVKSPQQSSSKTNKAASHNTDPSNFHLSQHVKADAVEQVSSSQGNSDGNKVTLNADKADEGLLANQYFALANHAESAAGEEAK